MNAETTTTEIPQPDFPHHAYGVDLSWLGEDGGMVARGHIPDLRFIAACNHMARTEAGLCNVCDDKSLSLEDARDAIMRRWACPVPPKDPGNDWEITWRDVTAQTPGAIPVTVLWP